MDFSNLERIICDVIKEGQVKLGYRKETIRLYYPITSLNHYLKTNLAIQEMKTVLKEFCDSREEKLGKIAVSNEGERFCISCSPEVSEYIYLHTEQQGFLYDFIDTISRHNITFEDIAAQFTKYSDCVHVEKVTHGEFDYLIYFEDEKPDAFRYCIIDEGCHFIYHRFSLEDYADLDF